MGQIYYSFYIYLVFWTFFFYSINLHMQTYVKKKVDKSISNTRTKLEFLIYFKWVNVTLDQVKNSTKFSLQW